MVTRPPALAAIPESAVVELDVRDALRAGEEPFSQIMAARQAVPPGGALCIRAIFEPAPLYAVMEKQGMTHHTERLDADDWRVWFYPAAAGTVEEGPGTTPDTGAWPSDDRDPATRDADGSVVVLDVRGMEPPEPMVRTLAALEELPPGGTVVQINVRVPQLLLPQLEARGFEYEIREQAPDLVRVFIRRASDPGGPSSMETDTES